MGTRGIIARPAGDTWAGVYHHWDSYPSGLGKALWDMAHGPFDGRLRDMMHTLLDEHRGGWSTIVNKDWDKAPGFREYDPTQPNILKEPEAYAAWDKEHNQPQCYCHGDRREGPFPLLTPEGDDGGAEWVYVIDVLDNTMSIYEAEMGDGAHAVGMFGVNPARTQWTLRCVVNLDGPEPDWASIQNSE